MSTDAIKVEGLGKSFLIGHMAQRVAGYRSVRDAARESMASVFRKTQDLLSGRAIVQGDNVEEYWALKDVDFTIERGERVGIIGRNGAGKSTLLKVLSRITEPTTGRATISGRVASLLEVGTGFHPELTGRENIYLNGAILGMGRREIARKFDEIVEFSEIDKFLDTPVKRYSSGMYVRLAFSVAAHLEPDILVVDEVLAVGDARFQKKCMGRMEEVGKEGRTVLFVSHNMGAISELCTRAILLKQGQVVADGPTPTVIEQYMSAGSKQEFVRGELPRQHPVSTTYIKMTSASGRALEVAAMGEDATLEVGFRVEERLANVSVAVLLSRSGIGLLYLHDNDMTPSLLELHREPGDYVARIPLPLSQFKEGHYSIEVHMGAGQTNMTTPEASISFDIEGYEINTNSMGYRVDRPGHLYMPQKWEIEKC